MFFEGKDNGSMEKIQDAIAETLTLVENKRNPDEEAGEA